MSISTGPRDQSNKKRGKNIKTLTYKMRKTAHTLSNDGLQKAIDSARPRDKQKLNRILATR